MVDIVFYSHFKVTYHNRTAGLASTKSDNAACTNDVRCEYERRGGKICEELRQGGGGFAIMQIENF